MSQAHGLQPHRVRQFKLSNAPTSARSRMNVVGLYVDPSEHAIVLSVDGKSQSRRSIAPRPAPREGARRHYDARLHPSVCPACFLSVEVVSGNYCRLSAASNKASILLTGLGEWGRCRSRGVKSSATRPCVSIFTIAQCCSGGAYVAFEGDTSDVVFVEPFLGNPLSFAREVLCPKLKSGNLVTSAVFKNWICLIVTSAPSTASALLLSRCQASSDNDYPPDRALDTHRNIAQGYC